MQAIGGYFGFENNSKPGRHFHNTPYQLDCGRSALELILLTLKPKKIFVPYYTCDALLEPLIKHQINYSFYAINEAFEIAEEIIPAKNEYLLYINFFGLKDFYCKQLIKKYNRQIILDNTMAFFFKHNTGHWGFNSCRKFFGVVDGAYLQSPLAIKEKLLPQKVNHNLTADFLFLRNENLVQEGYLFFKQNEACFGKGIYKMSNFSNKVMGQLNYKDLISKRNSNFSFLHAHLKSRNTLQPGLFLHDGAMFYPYLPAKKIPHQKFWSNLVFIPKLWPDCIDRLDGFEWEKKLSGNLLPLPIDHRYGMGELKNILKLIL